MKTAKIISAVLFSGLFIWFWNAEAIELKEAIKYIHKYPSLWKALRAEEEKDVSERKPILILISSKDCEWCKKAIKVIYKFKKEGKLDEWIVQIVSDNADVRDKYGLIGWGGVAGVMPQKGYTDGNNFYSLNATPYTEKHLEIFLKLFKKKMLSSKISELGKITADGSKTCD